MNGIAAVIVIICAYYAYQWGSGQKKEPNGIVMFLVMISSLIVTLPAYYLGKRKLNKKEDK